MDNFSASAGARLLAQANHMLLPARASVGEAEASGLAKVRFVTVRFSPVALSETDSSVSEGLPHPVVSPGGKHTGAVAHLLPQLPSR